MRHPLFPDVPLKKVKSKKLRYQPKTKLPPVKWRKLRVKAREK